MKEFRNKMITYKNENIIKTDCLAIAHGVNCQGKMNSGVAKAIRDRWPGAYRSYQKFYEKHEFNPPLGFVDTAVVNDLESPENIRIIGNCFTQEFYGRDGVRYANPMAIRNAVYQFSINVRDVLEIPDTEWVSIAIPKIGCGLGGLDWEKEILPIITEISEKMFINFVVYDNGEKPV